MTMPIGPDFIALQVRDLVASAQFSTRMCSASSLRIEVLLARWC